VYMRGCPSCILWCRAVSPFVKFTKTHLKQSKITSSGYLNQAKSPSGYPVAYQIPTNWEQKCIMYTTTDT